MILTPMVWVIMICEFANIWGILVMINEGPNFIDKILCLCWWFGGVDDLEFNLYFGLGQAKQYFNLNLWTLYSAIDVHV